MININIDELKQKVLEKFNSSNSPDARARYEHSLSVAKRAVELVNIHNFQVDIKKVEIAGLIHDYAKFLTMNDYFEIVKEYNLDEEILEVNFSILHALLGPYVIKKELGIEDQEILEAVQYHTTGRPKMGLLEEILYLADFTEPDRVDEPKTLNKIKEIRELSNRNYKRAIAMILDFTINKIISKKYDLFELTRLSFDNYEKYLHHDEAKVAKVLETLDHNLVKNIIIYDVRERTPLYDYVIITTSLSQRQMEAALNYLKEAFNINRIEKGESWSLIDLSDIIVHVFTEEERENYGLDTLLRNVPHQQIS